MEHFYNVKELILKYNYNNYEVINVFHPPVVQNSSVGLI